MTKMTEQCAEELLRGVVEYVIADNESREGTEKTVRDLTAMGVSEEEMLYFGFPETA